MTLSSNEVTNKWVAELYEIRYGRCWQLTKPNSSSPSEGGWERSANNFVWGLLEVQDSLEGLYVVKRVLCAIIKLHLRQTKLGGKGHSKTLAVKGESVRLSMPSRFIAVFPFIAFFTSSSSFLKLFIMWSLSCMDCPVYSVASFPLLFSGLLASLSCLVRLSWWCKVLLPFGWAWRFNSSFCFISSCTFAVRAWICWAITTGSGGGTSAESIKW